MSGRGTGDAAVLAAARGGDERAFAALVEPLRPALLAHCYRMLGSFQDAEDALQDGLLRAWRAIGRFDGRSAFRTWLYTVATNAALRVLERRSRRALPTALEPASALGAVLADPLPADVWIEPFPDAGLAYEQREAVELSFVAALQHLPPRQRAVLLLRDVLGFSGAEAAAMLETSRPAIDSALQRAHRTIEAALPERTQTATVRDLGDEAAKALVRRFVEAWEATDVDGVVALLTEDAVLAMPPHPTWFAGRAAVGRFLAERPLSEPGRWRMEPVGANGQLAVRTLLADGFGGWSPHSVNVLTLRGDRIAAVEAFLMPALAARFSAREP